MEAKSMTSESESVSLAKRDLVQAWSVLEKVVVSLRKMGSHYSTNAPDTPLSPKRRRQMLEELDAYFGPELLRELTRARRSLGEYLGEEESEAISQRLTFWRPQKGGNIVT